MRKAPPIRFDQCALPIHSAEQLSGRVEVFAEDLLSARIARFLTSSHLTLALHERVLRTIAVFLYILIPPRPTPYIRVIGGCKLSTRLEEFPSVKSEIHRFQNPICIIAQSFASHSLVSKISLWIQLSSAERNGRHSMTFSLTFSGNKVRCGEVLLHLDQSGMVQRIPEIKRRLISELFTRLSSRKNQLEFV